MSRNRRGFLTAAILASPGAMRRKVIGLAVGVPILIALNLTRLVHLFSLGVYHPEAFTLAHDIVTLQWASLGTLRDGEA